MKTIERTEGRPACEIRSGIAFPDEAGQAEDHPVGETHQIAVDSACSYLVELGRRREQIIRRQRSINQLGECDFTAHYMDVFGIRGKVQKGDFKALRGKASEIRDRALKLLPLCQDELLDLIGPEWTQEAHVAFKAALIMHSRPRKIGRNGKPAKPPLTDKEAEVAARLCVDLEADARSLDVFDAARKTIEERMVETVRTLPVCEWWVSQDGCAELGLARIVGEVGNLSNYSTVSKVWKRLGLHPIVKNGVSRSGSGWRMAKPSLSAEEWVAAGYVPRRRSVVFQVSDPIIKLGRGRYYQVFADRKQYEAEKLVAEGKVILTTGKATVESWKKAGLPTPITSEKTAEKKGFLRAIHIHRRAIRYMEKRLIRDLRSRWGGLETSEWRGPIEK